MSDTLGNDAPRTWPRACSVRAPHGAPSTWQHALDVRIELTRLQQVRTRAHQLLQPRPPPRTHTSCGRIEHIVVRHADLARLLTLFAGMAVVATTSMARARRAVPAISRCVHPTIPPLVPSTTPPHRSPRACATARRFADLLIRREQAAQDDFFRAEKLLVVQQHSASTRCCCGSGERWIATSCARASWTPPKAAKAAAQLGPRPQ